ncbi:MAG TPA: DUF3617 family protein, partial [Burkholderiales bacterium]|nr:DUF3617 family protein [Burkholderiales bacterium]
MRITPSCFIAAAVLALDAHGATPNMREGEWEMKVKIEMPSVPMAVPPQVMQRCITKKDLADAERNLSGPLPGDSRCKITDHKMQGNTATW